MASIVTVQAAGAEPLQNTLAVFIFTTHQFLIDRDKKGNADQSRDTQQFNYEKHWSYIGVEQNLSEVIWTLQLQDWDRPRPVKSGVDQMEFTTIEHSWVSWCTMSRQCQIMLKLHLSYLTDKLADNATVHYEIAQ